MTRYRRPALALLVSVLLAVVAIAADGRPLGGAGSGSSRGPSSGFLNYVFTTAVLFVVVLAAITVWALTARSPVQRKRARRSSLLALLLFWLTAALLVWALASNGFLRRLHHLEKRLNVFQPLSKPPPTGPAVKGGTRGHSAQLRWDEVAIVFALLGALGVAAFVAGRRRPAPGQWRFASQAAVFAALDESLDDLRSEPDLRKAIIAAYARMERALALAGLPRRPAEAPLEYVERALGDLETSTGAIRKLTDLFEWAKFSHHEPDPSMRDDAIEALVAVRDELRAPAVEPVPA
ncbi:MAG: DUF4129 domain-containing protein [Gaiellaceae bacterium]